MKTLEAILILLLAVLVRWCISLNKYSGAGKPPMFGDYEAQRHWMEITFNIPITQWYHNSTENDLMYWGLDYPPLTAYHSWINGYISHRINPNWVALNSSRGHESYGHKLFMRYSVLAVDVLLYFPVIFLLSCFDCSSKDIQLKYGLLFLLYPGLMLIDHGHFQYNCVSLGLALWAILSLGKGHDLLGSISFVLALNYKQMELYHAFPFFFFLLGSCFRSQNQNGLLRLIKIGVTVIAAFGICWLPFLHSKDSVVQVMHRMFPFARGLYEDKVANVWCSLSVLVKLKNFLTTDQLVLLCLGSTLLFCLPSCLDLLMRPSFLKFKYSLINCSFVFFLFSFHVHEKSILLVAVIVNMFCIKHSFWNLWFSIISSFSMLPLLIKDGLVLALIGTVCLYIILTFSCVQVFPLQKHTPASRIYIQKSTFFLSMLGVILLTVGSLFVTPPTHLPDLFPVLVSIYSCAHYIIFLMFFHIQQFTCHNSNIMPQLHSTKKRQ